MFNMTTIKAQLSNGGKGAQSGSKLMYTSIGIGLVVGIILFRLFFKHVPGLIHCVGFSVSTGKNPDVAAEPSLSSSSRLKLLLGALLPPASGYAAYLLLPKYFPNIFQ